MANEYPQTSPYYETPIVSGSLGLMVNISIPKFVDDIYWDITVTYSNRPDLLAYDLYGMPQLWWVFANRNPNVLVDPLFDFVTGTSIYLPKAATLKSILGY